MSNSDHKTNFKFPTAGLVIQLFAIILLPLTIILVAITFGSVTIHQKAMRSLVGERDAIAVRTAANALSAQVNNRLNEIQSIGELLSANAYQPTVDTLDKISNLMPDFDAGIAGFTPQGQMLTLGEYSPMLHSWTADRSWQEVFPKISTDTGKVLLALYPENGEMIGLISARLADNNLLVGAFSIEQLVLSTMGDILTANREMSFWLVGANGQILFDNVSLNDQSVQHPGVAEALQGKSGTVYVKVGNDEHVTAYSPVSSTGWALITEESWESVVTPTLRTSQIAPLVLVPAVLIMLLALYLGANQVVKPLSRLEAKASTLASGDFTAIKEPVGGIAEIQHLQQELIHMAGKVQEAQHSLHGYIGVITEAQEEERKRLARELHDDTLQALIALKQRVQLAQLELQPAVNRATPQSAELEEIATLTEQTIENLRRLTRALRPIYLEDLGLVPALEMLARETGQVAGIPLEFHRQGTERRLEPAVELALYRMAQEGCSNIIRHAQAAHGSLSISFSPDGVTLRVDDDGEGFMLPANPAEYATHGHYGLLGLHERADLIGARADISTAPGRGTHITITIPVTP